MSRRCEPLIMTVSGNYFNLEDPDATAHVVSLPDIIHALSNICRYTGHCRDFYSVAQHSVLCYEEAKARYPDDHYLQKCALLHDAAEAYTNDITTPLKGLLPDFQRVESRIEGVVFDVLGLPRKLPHEVKEIDLVLLATEKRDLLPACGEWDMLKGVVARERKIRPWGPSAARHAFYVACNKLNIPWGRIDDF